MGRIGTKSPYAVVEWCDASSAMRAYCWMALPLSHCVSFAARRLLRLLHGGSPLDKVAHTARSCLVGRGRVVAMVSWRDLLGAICVPSGRVDVISPSSSLRLVYVRATVFCLLTARSMLLLSKRLYSGSYEKRLRFCLAASSRY